MTLSWTLRLVCVLTVVVGLVLASSQFLLALFARRILRLLDPLTARWRERILYLVQIGPALIAVFAAAALCLPAYLHGETNLEAENVSVWCLLLAVVVVAWFAFSFLRALPIAIRTLRVARASRRAGNLLHHSGNIPVLSLPDPGPPVRLIGFSRPLILVSSNALFAPDMLELALAHERSHAAHCDNWKLLSLSFLPRLLPGLDRLLPDGNPWTSLWQRAADWAADDDAVHGDSSRSLLLAEALVLAARSANATRAPRIVSSALTASDAGLATRIDRLIHPRAGMHPSAFSGIALIVAILGFAATAAYALPPWIYEFSERLLHL